MKKMLLLVSMFFVLVSCKEISGSLTVDQAFDAVVVKSCGWDPFGSCEPTKTIAIQPGNYKSKIDFSSKNNIKLELKANKVTETILLKRPANFEFPVNGQFHLAASQIGQSFDVHGDVMTTVTTTERRRGYESCTYTVNEYVCYPDSNGHTQCGYQPRQVWGNRPVEYYLESTDRVLTAHITASESKLAHFHGQRIDTEKIYLYQGICR
jgi:hypothetical protein